MRVQYRFYQYPCRLEQNLLCYRHWVKMFTLFPGRSGLVIIAILVITMCGVAGSEDDICDCSITVMGPLRDGTVVFVCNAYTPEGVGYRDLSFTWLLTNTSGGSLEEVTTQLRQASQPKMIIMTPVSGNYTCLVSWPGMATPRNCSVSLSQSPAGTDHRDSPLEVLPDCVDPRAPMFLPAPDKRGIKVVNKGHRSRLICVAPLLQGSLHNSKTEAKFTMELFPLKRFYEITSDVVMPNLSTSHSNLSNPHLQSTNSVKSNKEICIMTHDQRDRTITIIFHSASESCHGIYVCSAGAGSRVRSSILVAINKSDDEDDDDHGLQQKVADNSKKQKLNDRGTQQERVEHPTQTKGGYRGMQQQVADNSKKQKPDDRLMEHKEVGYHMPEKEEEEENNMDVLGLTVGVVFMVLLTGIAVACAVVWRKRTLRHHSRYLARATSTSKAPLFINKAYAKEEKNELEEFPRKNIRFLDHIGKGTFGTVVMAEIYNLQKQKTGSSASRWKVVAIKMTLISEKTNEQLKKDFLNEVALMKSIPVHPNIITVYASCTAHDPYLMILEHAKHGDLKKYLTEHRTERNYANAAYLAYGVDSRRIGNYYSTNCGHHSEDKKNKHEKINTDSKKYNSVPTNESELITSRDVLSFALQICKGLDHLTQCKIVHRDVAARNVLVCEHKVVKISDFGLARKVGEQDIYERTTKGLLPIRWMSPEALLHNQYTEKSDVWSFGVLLWELITLGSTPYPGLDSCTILEKIRHRELLVCPPHSSVVVNNVIFSCWREDPNTRPSFSQLVQEIEKLLESEVEYLDLDQINDHEYSTLD